MHVKAKHAAYSRRSPALAPSPQEETGRYEWRAQPTRRVHPPEVRIPGHVRTLTPRRAVRSPSIRPIGRRL